MARVVGGIGASHAPSMEHVYDRGETEADEWKPLFEPFEEIRRWLEDLRPDVLFVIYNDHFDHLWLDAWPQFALGCAETYPIADEGQGARDPRAGTGGPAWAPRGSCRAVPTPRRDRRSQRARRAPGVPAPPAPRPPSMRHTRPRAPTRPSSR